jgi:fluoride exporter
MNVWLAVFIGGGIGSLMRFGITRLLLAWDVRSTLPWATLCANVLSCVILAWALFRLQPHLQDRPALGAFITVGICGGFSTFSTFSYENFLLFREGLAGWAIANIAVNTLACLSIFYFVARTT